MEKRSRDLQNENHVSDKSGPLLARKPARILQNLRPPDSEVNKVKQQTADCWRGLGIQELGGGGRIIGVNN